MAISSMLAIGFSHAFGGMSAGLSKEVRLGTYQDTVRLAIHSIARDIRLAGANPTGNPELFDKIPTSDVPVDLDPDLDGNFTNGILVRADRRGLDGTTPDGDTEDTLETVMYHYDAKTSRILRHTWRVVPERSGTETEEHEQEEAAYDFSPFVEGVCSFSLRYLDRLDQPTTTPDLVATVIISLTTASGPGECFNTNSFTRPTDVYVRIRNR